MMPFKIFIVKILDKLFLHPFFSSYFKSRVESMIINNMGRSGMAIIEWNDAKGNRVVGLVFKYPFPCKIVYKTQQFEKFWPGLIGKLRLVADKQKKVKV